jgi:hypothetical protein
MGWLLYTDQPLLELGFLKVRHVLLTNGYTTQKILKVLIRVLILLKRFTLEMMEMELLAVREIIQPH